MIIKITELAYNIVRKECEGTNKRRTSQTQISEKNKQRRKLELSRAHTPRALSGICRFLHRDRPVMLTISASPVVGMVDGRGYDGRQKTLFVTNDSKHIQASLSLIPTDWLRLGVAQVPRCRDLAIFVVTRRTGGRTDVRLLYPCACARGN